VAGPGPPVRNLFTCEGVLPHIQVGGLAAWMIEGVCTGSKACYKAGERKPEGMA
jgi:hypothetical protein